MYNQILQKGSTNKKDIKVMKNKFQVNKFSFMGNSLPKKIQESNKKKEEENKIIEPQINNKAEKDVNEIQQNIKRNPTKETKNQRQQPKLRNAILSLSPTNVKDVLNEAINELERVTNKYNKDDISENQYKFITQKISNSKKLNKSKDTSRNRRTSKLKESNTSMKINKTNISEEGMQSSHEGFESINIERNLFNLEEEKEPILNFNSKIIENTLKDKSKYTSPKIDSLNNYISKENEKKIPIEDRYLKFYNFEDSNKASLSIPKMKNEEESKICVNKKNNYSINKKEDRKQEDDYNYKNTPSNASKILVNRNTTTSSNKEIYSNEKYSSNKYYSTENNQNSNLNSERKLQKDPQKNLLNIIFFYLDIEKVSSNLNEIIYLEDFLNLTREDMVELKIPLIPRNRILNFINAFQKWYVNEIKDEVTPEIIHEFFNKNSRHIYKNKNALSILTNLVSPRVKNTEEKSNSPSNPMMIMQNIPEEINILKKQEKRNLSQPNILNRKNENHYVSNSARKENSVKKKIIFTKENKENETNHKKPNEIKVERNKSSKKKEIKVIKPACNVCSKCTHFNPFYKRQKQVKSFEKTYDTINKKIESYLKTVDSSKSKHRNYIQKIGKVNNED
ncbi:MAG: hypothetical protein MJ252_12685 [archaeon]|nr:hypothetical protein [archaeon]